MSAQNNEERWAHYLVCRERGHKPSGYTTASIPPMKACKFCLTYYWTECIEHEYGAPTDPTWVDGIAPDYADSAE